MYSKDTKDLVLLLRSKGKTYSEIKKGINIDIPKSTMSGWLKNLELSPRKQSRLTQNITLKLKEAQLKGVETNKLKRANYLETLRKRNIHLLNSIDNSVQRIILSILYLTEGAKHKSTQVLTFTNSNPEIITFYLKLLRNCYKLDPQKFRIRIQGRADQQTSEIENFWQSITKIPTSQFYPTYIDKRTAGKPTLKPEYKGVCTVMYFSTEIQLELELLADSMLKSTVFGPVVQW